MQLLFFQALKEDSIGHPEYREQEPGLREQKLRFQPEETAKQVECMTRILYSILGYLYDGTSMPFS